MIWHALEPFIPTAMMLNTGTRIREHITSVTVFLHNINILIPSENVGVCIEGSSLESVKYQKSGLSFGEVTERDNVLSLRRMEKRI